MPAAVELLSRVGFPPTVTAAAGTPPRRLVGYAASLAVHAAVVLAIATAPSSIRKPEPPSLVRLVFHEPPPPPPPAVVSAPEPAPVVPPKPKKKPAVASRPRKIEPKPALAPAPVLAPEVPTSTAPPPVASGVSGGVEGGVVGGVVGARGTEPVPVGAVARPPLLVRHVMPDYPPEARRRGVEGLVRLEAVLDLKGRVEDPIRIVESIPDLDAAATAALRAWRFSPARNAEGDAVRVILEVPIRFVLR